MTEKDFILWLHGFFEISNATTLDENQVKIIKDHLGLFFQKVTPNRTALDDWLHSKETPIFQIWQVPIVQPNIPSPEIDPYKVTCCEGSYSEHPKKTTYY
jgi:hypothetical protein